MSIGSRLYQHLHLHRWMCGRHNAGPVLRIASTDPPRYVVRAKERGVFQREKDKLLAEQKLLEQEILDFTNQHEAELNDLLQEYWMTRKQAGE